MITDENCIFAKNLKKARENAKMTQAKLAEKADVTSATISAFERLTAEEGKLPTLRVVRKLAEALGISIDWLCGYEVKTNITIAFMTIIKALNPLIEFEQKNESKTVAKLMFNCDSTDVSATEIRKFLEEYSSVREIERSKLGNNEMIKTLENQLIEKYAHLPGLPDYKPSE